MLASIYSDFQERAKRSIPIPTCTFCHGCQRMAFGVWNVDTINYSGPVVSATTEVPTL